MVEPERLQMTTWRMHFECWVTEASDMPSECVILNAVVRQRWLLRRASVLRYTYSAFLVIT